VLRFFGNIKASGRIYLHPVGQLQTMNARFQLRICARRRACCSFSSRSTSSCCRCSLIGIVYFLMCSMSFSISVVLLDVGALVMPAERRLPVL